MLYRLDLAKEHNFQSILCHLTNNVAEVILNRVQVHNALDEVMIAELICALDVLASNSKCRVLVLRSNGDNFSAGADLNWMRKQAQMDFSDNLNDAKQLALLMKKLDDFPKPTIALVNGAAFGGALGLICACDIAVANEQAKFCLSEVKLGLIPATISPYVIRAMGIRNSRRYMLSAELFDAQVAKQLNLIHEISDDLDSCTKQIIESLLDNAPQAMALTKSLIKHQESGVIDNALIEYTAKQIAQVRVAEEAQEGLSAFFDKREPIWKCDKKQ